MDLTAQLLAAVSDHCARTGMSRARLATVVINDGKFFSRIEAGGGLTIRTYEKFMAFMAERPADTGDAQAFAGNKSRSAEAT